MSALECIRQGRGLTHGRRIYMKRRRWREAEWYASWPAIADEWEAAAGEWGNK